MNQLKEIKQYYRRYMNGMVAQSMRSKGMPYRVNFGLTLPLLRRLAGMIEPGRDIAEALWQDKGVRESLLLAPMVYPHELFGSADACRWADEIPTAEVADFCCKYLFAHIPAAGELACEWAGSEAVMQAYTGFRLAYSLLAAEPEAAWVRRITTAALARAAADDAAAGMARRWLVEAVSHPWWSAEVVACLDGSPATDSQLAARLREMAGEG